MELKHKITRRKKNGITADDGTSAEGNQELAKKKREPTKLSWKPAIKNCWPKLTQKPKDRRRNGVGTENWQRSIAPKNRRIRKGKMVHPRRNWP
jgi:hypothetical protein